MLLYFTFLFKILIFQIVYGQPTNFSQKISSVPFPLWPKNSLNRTRRENRLRHQPACAELDKTEDSYFVAVIITKHRGRLLCMGSIIDEYHVLTAKNCLEKTDAATLQVVAGYLSPYWGKNSQVKFAQKVMKNERDLAIIKVQKPFTITTTVKPIRIIGPEKMNEDFKTAYEEPYGIAGYELPKHLERTDFLPKPSAYHMRDENFESSKCSSCYSNEHGDPDDKEVIFCTDGKANFSWSGVGSPAVITMEKEYIQVAVLVRGVCTADPKPYPTEKDPLVPNLHIRTDKFYKWIKANSYIGR